MLLSYRKKTFQFFPTKEHLDFSGFLPGWFHAIAHVVGNIPQMKSLPQGTVEHHMDEFDAPSGKAFLLLLQVEALEEFRAELF